MRLTRYFAAKVIAVVSLSLVSLGQQPPPQQDPDDNFDPDSVNRGVARISVMSGDVSVQRGDADEIVAAAINAPLVVGDRVMTGPNSRAEVQFDWANMIRIASDSEIRLAELADRRFQIQLARGVATFRVLRASDADVDLVMVLDQDANGFHVVTASSNACSSEMFKSASPVHATHSLWDCPVACGR